jgi:hypothetical protein
MPFCRKIRMLISGRIFHSRTQSPFEGQVWVLDHGHKIVFGGHTEGTSMFFYQSCVYFLLVTCFPASVTRNAISREPLKIFLQILQDHIGLVGAQGTIAKLCHFVAKYACSSWVAFFTADRNFCSKDKSGCWIMVIK